MATVLIIDDRQVDRKLLATILRSHGHDVSTASDGEEALRLLATARPDLVISDILMPGVDGHEVVRLMRGTPSLADIPVVFYTATYHEREARTLAQQLGVFEILPKPSSSDVILATAAAALRSRVDVTVADALDRPLPDRAERLETLATPTDAFATEREQMTAAAESTRQIARERDPHSLMQRLSLEARRLTFAQHAVAGLVDESGSKASHVFTSGFSDRVAGSLKPPSLKGTVIVEVLAERRPVRVRRPLVGPELLRVPGDDLPVQSLLSVPVASPTKVFGWLSLRNKLGAEEFTDVDERVALTLATYTAVAYENAQELDELKRRLLQREEQLVHATARVRHVREEERAQLSRQLHDQLGQSLAGLKLGLQQVVSLLPPTTDTTDLGARVNTMIQAVDTSIASVRDLANELRPTVLDRLGLVAALEWQTETFERRCGIPCRVATSIDRVALDAGRSTSIFRIVEEALTNILQHAHATHVAVTVRKAAGRLKIAIVDDGTGISEREMSDGRSLGLIGMRERAALLGGTLDIQKRRAGGTSVALDVPLGERRRHSRGHDD